MTRESVVNAVQSRFRNVDIEYVVNLIRKNEITQARRYALQFHIGSSMNNTPSSEQGKIFKIVERHPFLLNWVWGRQFLNTGYGIKLLRPEDFTGQDEIISFLQRELARELDCYTSSNLYVPVDGNDSLMIGLRKSARRGISFSPRDGCYGLDSCFVLKN